jgi:hypothetical protein
MLPELMCREAASENDGDKSEQGKKPGRKIHDEISGRPALRRNCCVADGQFRYFEG